MKLVVNGVARDVDGAGERSLLFVLREELALTGAKYGCGEGECGACTVLVDGEATRACITKLVEVAGRTVTTVEGLARDGALHPVQRTFLAEGALQCGFCTPGMITAAAGFLARHDEPSDDDIARALERNVCRCGCHPRIVRAVKRAADEIAGEHGARAGERSTR